MIQQQRLIDQPHLDTGSGYPLSVQNSHAESGIHAFFQQSLWIKSLRQAFGLWPACFLVEAQRIQDISGIAQVIRTQIIHTFKRL